MNTYFKYLYPFLCPDVSIVLLKTFFFLSNNVDVTYRFLWRTFQKKTKLPVRPVRQKCVSQGLILLVGLLNLTIS